jgi:hypothetical protein
VISIKKKRVFVIFDLINESKQLDFIMEYSKRADSPITIIDHSVKWIPPEKKWVETLKNKMALLDLVIVMTGPKTYKAHNVLEEIDAAFSLGKPIYQTFGTQFGEYKLVPKAGKLYKWDWEGFKKMIERTG